jgi:hypothetical protein
MGDAARLDYRHRGTVDARLGLWPARHVEEFLPDWLPCTPTKLPGETSADSPGALRALLRHLRAAGLDDPRGEPLGESARCPAKLQEPTPPPIAPVRNG